VIWEVFRQAESKDYHVHVGNVHAPDAEMATQFARIMHARRKPAKSLWVVPKPEIAEVHENDPRTNMGGTTQKEYRWATNYDTGRMAEEIEESEAEQQQAQAERAEGDR